MEQFTKYFFKFEMVLVGIIAAILLLAFCSCTTTQYIPVIENHTDTLIQTKVQRDSIYVRDSTIVEKGDSIIKIEHWHTKYVKKQVHDTIYQHRVDSVPQPYPYAIYKDRELTTVQVVLMTIGGLAIMALLVFIAVKLKRFLPCR